MSKGDWWLVKPGFGVSALLALRPCCNSRFIKTAYLIQESRA